MKTFVDLIEILGDRELSKLLGVPLQHIRVMKNRNSIAPDHWPALVKWGVSYEKLTSLRKASLERRA